MLDLTIQHIFLELRNLINAGYTDRLVRVVRKTVDSHDTRKCHDVSYRYPSGVRWSRIKHQVEPIKVLPHDLKGANDKPGRGRINGPDRTLNCIRPRINLFTVVKRRSRRESSPE